MMTDEEIRAYEKAEFREKMVSLVQGFFIVLIRVFMALIVICAVLTLILTLASKLELDPVKNIDNVWWWFLKVPAVICISYYFFLKRICKVVKYIGMEKEERELHWNLFRYLVVLPIILILVIKIASMMVSPTAFPIWMHYGPIWDGITLEYYQPIWAEHVNNCYASTQIFLEDVSHLTGIKWLDFLPTLDSLQ